MIRRRLAAVALVAALAGGVGSAQVATADPAIPPDGTDLVELSGRRGDYWACLALDHIDIGTCLENPLPDRSGLHSLEDLLGIVAR